MRGKCLKKEMTNPNVFISKIDISTLKNGNYILEINTKPITGRTKLKMLLNDNIAPKI